MSIRVMNNMRLGEILGSILPDEPVESEISGRFVKPLIQALGFDDQEYLSEFNTGDGSVDFALRHNSNPEDPFYRSKENPYVLIEVKARATGNRNKINLEEGTPAHYRTFCQLRDYLLGSKCSSSQWGILTNSVHIQLIRRHGRVVIPATPTIYLTPENVDSVVESIRAMIHSPPRSLTVCIYNNKGGVGKTTTVINLAATLATQRKKVLVIDFDSQRDLTTTLGLSIGKVSLSDCLTSNSLDVHSAIQPYKIFSKKTNKFIHIFDVIPADTKLETFTSSHAVAHIQKRSARLRDLIQPLNDVYDYILIDCPTQWLFFSKSGVYAADSILIPTRHSDINSLKSAGRVISEFINDEVKKERKDGGPMALPIFFNGAPTEAAAGKSLETANREIKNIVDENKALAPYFWPKDHSGKTNREVFKLRDFAVISSSAFNHIPAVFQHKRVAEYYLEFAKEYFLYE
ncbi:MAG: ParA family protein [Synechococcales cyanobacterium]